MEIQGFPELAAKLEKLAGGINDGTGKSLYQIGETIMTASKRAAPVKTGNLRGSGTVDQPVTSGDTVSVKLHYDAPYAFFVHEGHETHSGTRVAPNKFLESAVTAAQSHFESDLATPLKAAIERLVA